MSETTGSLSRAGILGAVLIVMGITAVSLIAGTAAAAPGGIPSCQAELQACQAELAKPKLTATGQKTCWDSTGAVIPCFGTGEDGDIQAGAPLSYTDNGDGTITDNVTGLMWEKLSSDGSIHDIANAYTWPNAFLLHVHGLNQAKFAGYSDWRLPNVKELQSIADYDTVNPAVSSAFNNNCVSGCTVLTCSCTQLDAVYWSSTTFVHFPAEALGVLDGVVTDLEKTLFAAVRAVRGGL